MGLKEEYSLLQRESISYTAKQIFGRAISFEEQEKLIDAVEQSHAYLNSPNTIECPDCEGGSLSHIGIYPCQTCMDTGRVPDTQKCRKCQKETGDNIPICDVCAIKEMGEGTTQCPDCGSIYGGNGPCISNKCVNKPQEEDVAVPNPKYEQAVKVAKQFNLEWVSVVPEFGQYEKTLRVNDHGAIYQYKIAFTEDMLEFSRIAEEMVRLEIYKAAHELVKHSGYSEFELKSRFVSGLEG